jgi:hypothetical protein
MFFYKEYQPNSHAGSYTIWIFIFIYYLVLKLTRSRKFDIAAPAPAKSSGSGSTTLKTIDDILQELGYDRVDL